MNLQMSALSSAMFRNIRARTVLRRLRPVSTTSSRLLLPGTHLVLLWPRLP